MNRKKEPQLEEAVIAKAVETTETDEQLRFGKHRLLNSQCYSHRRDMLSMLLDDEKEYSHGEVTAMIKKFEETEVK